MSVPEIIEHSDDLPAPDEDDTALGAPEDEQPEDADIDHAGDLESGD